MPFKSEKQRRFLWANRPDIAERWEKMSKGYMIAVVGISKERDSYYYDVKASYYEGKKQTHENLKFPLNQKSDFVKAIKEFCRIHHISFVDDVMITGRLWKPKGSSKVV